MRYSLQELHQPVEDYCKTHSPFSSFPFITLLPSLLYSLWAYPRTSFHRTNNTQVFPKRYQQRASSPVMDYAIMQGWDTLFKTGVIKEAMCRSFPLIIVNSVYRKTIAHTTVQGYGVPAKQSQNMLRTESRFKGSMETFKTRKRVCLCIEINQEIWSLLSRVGHIHYNYLAYKEGKLIQVPIKWEFEVINREREIFWMSSWAAMLH